MALLVLGVAAAAVSSYPPLPHAPLGYSTWQWAPGTHWGPKQGQYDAVTEKICRTQADAMMDKVGRALGGFALPTVNTTPHDTGIT